MLPTRIPANLCENVNDGDRALSEDIGNVNFGISLGGYTDEETAKEVGNAVSQFIKILCKYIDLTSLVGISINYDYQYALDSVDRGFETSNTLTPSDGDVVGVAMVVRVMRDGEPKCHIVFNALHIEGVVSPVNSPEWLTAIGIISHECAHVSNSNALNKCFPGRMMSYRYKDIHEQLRGECWLSVMEEYCATRLSAQIGEDQSKMFKTSFFRQASKLYDKARDSIFDYQFHQSVDKTLNEVYSEIEITLKLAAYFLGDAAAKGINYKDGNEDDMSEFSWLTPYIERLNSANASIFESYGRWKSIDEFEVISDILDDIAKYLGVTVSLRPQGVWVDISYF